jgi:predicted nucleotidyltransferase
MNKILIDKITGFFEDKPVIKAYLFGSYSRGEETPGSDVDILVELDYTQKVGIEFYSMQYELEKILEKKVDLVSANGVSKYIKPYIDNDKVLIYEK